MSHAVSASGGNVVRNHPLDQVDELCKVLGGYLRPAEIKTGLLEAVRITSEQLRATSTLARLDGAWPTGIGIWGEYILGVGGLVVRAISPVTTEHDRKYLLAMLEVWADTVFADRTTDLRIGLAAGVSSVIADSTGVAVPIAHRYRRTRFVERGHAPMEWDTRTAVEFVWGDAVQLRAFVGLVREHGALTWDPEAPRVLAELTGLSRTAAVVILTGYRGQFSRFGETLDKQQRADLEVAAAEIKDAAVELEEFDLYEFGHRTGLLTAALPEDPAVLWQPGGLRVLAVRFAQVWNARHGRRGVVPKSTLAAAIAVEPELNASCIARRPSVAALCATVADPASSVLLNCRLDEKSKKFDNAGGYADSDARNAYEFDNLWQPLIETCRWAYAFLPAGDPMREGIPGAIERLRAQLRQPGVVIGLGTVPGRTITSIRHRRASGPWPQSSDAGSFDDGLISATDDGWQGSWTLSVRTVDYLLDERTSDLRSMVHPCHRDALDHLDWIFGEECDRLVARIISGQVPTGAYETDPASSAPELVTEVASELGIDSDAAALYLQLATLIAPTDRHIRSWNGWKPARHRAAENVLLANGLVVRDKRGRAGRAIFLPGEWIEKPGVEAWKWDLHGLESRYREKFFRGASAPRKTLPELFLDAWRYLRDAPVSAESNTPVAEQDAMNVVRSLEPDAVSEKEQVSVTAHDAFGPVAATDVPTHPLDNYSRISNALLGHDYHGEPTAPRMLRAIRIASNLLRGDRLPETYPHWEHASGERAWVGLLHGVGYCAFRAIAPSTSESDRAHLLALLEVWADTVFADPSARLRIGRVDTELPAVHGESGAAIALGRNRTGGRGFVELRHGESDPPMLGHVFEASDIGPRWGDAAQLRSLIAMVRENGPVPWDDGAVQLLADRTGLSRAAAGLVQAGYVGWYLRPKRDLTTEQRKVLGITLPAAVDAARELGNRHFSPEDASKFFARVLPDDPTELWRPGGMRAVVERVADSWVAGNGRSAVVPVSTLTAAVAVRAEFGDSEFGASAAELCAMLVAPDAAPMLTRPVNSRLDKVDGRYTVAAEDAGRQFAFEKMWRSLIEAGRWAYADLPAGDPVRSGVPRAFELLRAQLRHPALILPAPGYPDDRGIEVFAQLSGVSVAVDADGGELYDDGPVVAYKNGPDSELWHLYFRPAHFGFTRHSDLLRAHSYHPHPEFTYLEWLFDSDCDRMLSRLIADDLPEGHYEAEPALCVPALVAEVEDRLGLGCDAAALYLQLLTLLNPTDRNIRLWNRWKPAHHSKIEDELIAEGLVIRDSRKSAGRTAFLPGRWVGKPGLEVWKLPLHNLKLGYRGSVENAGTSTPRRALPDLFHAAWRRTIAGDTPA